MSDESGIEPNKYKLIKEIFATDSDHSTNNLLNCMMAFDSLQERGFIEKFINKQGELDYRLTGRDGTIDILLSKDSEK